MGLTIDGLKGQTASVNALAEICKLDRRTVKGYLEQCEIDADKKSKEFDFINSVRALIYATKGQNTADRKNNAQARKCEIETAILEGQWIAIGDVGQIFRAFVGAVNREIQDSEIEDDKKERIIERLKDALSEFEDLTDE